MREENLQIYMHTSAIPCIYAIIMYMYILILTKEAIIHKFVGIECAVN
jgi:hypothetical protein